MGLVQSIVGGCLRGIYHRCSPYFHQRSRVVPLGRLDNEGRGARSSGGGGSYASLPQAAAFNGEHFWSLVEGHGAGIRRRSSGSVGRAPQTASELATVYCYVISASTNDCEPEKQILSSKIIPKIQKWASEKFQMQVIHIDMKQGLQSRENLQLLLELSLAELDRISQYHIPPFVIVLLSETLGWVPTHEEMAGLPTMCPPGTSLLEIEIMHGAYLSHNPNSIFMLRKPSFLHELPKKVLSIFFEPEALPRLNLLKNKLRQTFPEQAFTYQCSVVSRKLDLVLDYEIEVEQSFQTTLQEFMIHRLQEQQSHCTISQPFMELQTLHQENELIKSSSHELLDKENIVHKIQLYIDSAKTDFCPPLLVIGESGSGKSAIMAKIVKCYKYPRKNNHEKEPHDLKSAKHSNTTYMHSKKLNTRENSLNGWYNNQAQWDVFYHFVSGASRGNELRCILQRLWNIKGLSQPRVEEIKLEVNSLAKQVLYMLSKTTRNKTLILIDSIDEFIDEHPSHILKWLPAKLPPTIKIVLSCSPNAGIRKVLSSRDLKCLEVLVGSLSMSVSRNLANMYLQDAGIKPSEELLDCLMGKLSISNPLYIQEAILYLKNRLKSPGIENIDKYLLALTRSLPGDLQKLHQRRIIELESSEQGRYIIASLCLIQCSHRGLQEHELLTLLSALTLSGYRSSSESGSASDAKTSNPSPVHRKSLPNTMPSCGKADCFKLSPQVVPQGGMRQSTSFSSASELRRSSLAIPGPATFDGAFLYPPSRGSPSISLHSIDLPSSQAKKLSTSSSLHPPLDSELDIDYTPSKPLLEIDQVASRHNIEPCSSSWMPISSFTFASVLHKLLHFLKPNGEACWVIKDTAARKAVHRRYFKDPPTQSFPFSFCTSEVFYGADQDRTLYTLISHAYGEPARSQRSSPIFEMSNLDEVAGTAEINVSKRYNWWHARLAGYFSKTSSEQRQANELPYHLSYIGDHGRLTHCLTQVPLFEHLSVDINVMDLVKYWKYVGGYDSVVKLYQQMLSDVEIAGSYGSHDTVRLMHSVAWFLYRYGEITSAQNILVNAIAYEEEKLAGRSDSMASLHHSLFLILSHVSMKSQQHDHDTYQMLEAEHRLIQVASRCIGIYRCLPASSSVMASTLLRLSHHLYHFYELGGSAALSAKSALQQAREAAQEALELYSDKYDTKHILQAYLQLADVYLQQPAKVVQLLNEARELCRDTYGACNDVMIDIVERLASVYCNVLEDTTLAMQYYRDIFELTKELYGIDHMSTHKAQEKMDTASSSINQSKNKVTSARTADHRGLNKTVILIEAEINE